ncbi:class I SAM-dependent methyltransferase [Brevibacillus fulvus]|uniref:SAM-dependent methyltransferase n=1 Tax=Brevibacillus fulvus TaxID=1125967 RepID=A0A939BRJ2_9BACL|nr:class I SAM-dependent methyltransferase [Brevibacillus fulvus]MBM7589682.1 SAM-dependent methyltransferase [Brevibacillus fulvus]
MAEQEKWQTFFGEEYLYFSNEILTPERTAFEVKQIVEMLQLPPGASILDLGCGQGRMSIPLAQQGYQVTAYDGSPVLLEAARNGAESAGVKIDFVLGDMRELAFADTFDAVLNLGTAFGYVEDEQADAEILRRICTALKPNGHFVMETENRDFRLLHLKPRIWEEMHGQPVWSERGFDCVTGRWRETIRWYRGSELKQSVLDVRLYTATELSRLTSQAGLRVEAIYGGLDRSPLVPQSPRMALWAKKTCKEDGKT